MEKMRASILTPVRFFAILYGWQRISLSACYCLDMEEVVEDVVFDDLQKPVYSIREAAQLADCGYETIRRDVRDGKIRTVTIGKRKKIPAEALRKLLGIETKSAAPPMTSKDREELRRKHGI
jgi:excisionase family DNA binding protein